MESFFEHLFIDQLKPRKLERVIDIGCGSGNHLMHAGKLGLSLTGIDASPYMLDLAAKRLGSSFEFKKANAEDIPFDDNAFDYAMFINTLEFLDNPVRVLKEAGRVASRKVLILTFNRFSGYCQWGRLFGKFRKSVFSKIRTYSIWELKALINQAYGPVPLHWQTEFCLPFSLGRIISTGNAIHPANYFPFGFILGISVTLKYIYKTDNLIIKAGLKGAKKPAVEGIHTAYNYNSGVSESERSTSL